MKPTPPSEFERNCADAAGAPDVYGAPMIRTQMDKGDWAVLGFLALIWGGAFIALVQALVFLPREVDIPESGTVQLDLQSERQGGSLAVQVPEEDEGASPAGTDEGRDASCRGVDRLTKSPCEAAGRGAACPSG